MSQHLRNLLRGGLLLLFWGAANTSELNSQSPATSVQDHSGESSRTSSEQPLSIKQTPVQFQSNPAHLQSDALLVKTSASEIVVLTLEDCIQLALNNNLNLLSRRKDPQIAALELRGAASIFEPSVSASVQFNNQRVAPRPDEKTFFEATENQVTNIRAALSGLLPPGTSYQISAVDTATLGPNTGFATRHRSVLQFDVSQPLLRGFGTDVTMAQIRFSRHLQEAAKADFENFLSALVQNIHDKYHDVLFSRSNLIARNKDLALAEQLLRDNQQRVEIGAMAPLDVTRARALVFARRLDLIRADRQLINAENALKRLIYDDITPHLQTRLIPAEVPPPATVADPVVNRARALQKRPELRAAEARIAQNRIRLNTAKNELLPNLNMNLSAQTRGRDDDFWTSLRDAADGYETNWSVGLLLDVPLGFTSERALRDIAELRLRQSELNYASLTQDVILDVETALGNVETARLAYAAAREARIFSEESLSAEEELLRNGASTTYSVAQLQTDLAQARTAELRSLLDWYRSLAALARAEGTILELYKVNVSLDFDTKTDLPPPTKGAKNNREPARKTLKNRVAPSR